MRCRLRIESARRPGRRAGDRRRARGARAAMLAALVAIAGLSMAGCGSLSAGTVPSSTPATVTVPVPTTTGSTGSTSTASNAPAQRTSTDAVATDKPVSAAITRTLRLGSRGTQVRMLQRRLAQLRYLPADAEDGAFGARTWQAVVAFQGWTGLPMDGVVGPRTRVALVRAGHPRPWSASTGIEVHIGRQVLLLVRDGRTIRAIHVSTGMAGLPTPSGHFTIISRQPMSWSTPFHVWMPLAQYFVGGYALHEAADVPAYPASHGCVRIPAGEAQVVWDFGRIGMRVWSGE